MNNHLTPQDMLSYVDGELPKSKTRSAEEHLHSCWTCLAEVERLKGDIALILDAQNEQFLPALPAPPRQWASFQTLLARNLPQPQQSLWDRLIGLIPSNVRPASILLTSFIIAALVFATYSFVRAKAVLAKEVLRQVQIEDARRSTINEDQVIRERIHVRRATRRNNEAQSANVDTWKSLSATYWNVADNDSAAGDLRAQYRAHGIPVALPLSADSINSWGRAAGGAPTASRHGSDMDVNFAGTRSGPQGSVEQVSLLVQPDTWQVKQMTLEFSDETFEVTDEGYDVLPKSAVPADLVAFLDPEALPPSLLRYVPPTVSAAAANVVRLPMVDLDKTELNVLSTLHSMKADLGEPVSVTRSVQSVQVRAWQLPAERQEELRSALAGQMGVQVELAEPRTPANESASKGAAVPAPPSNGAPPDVEPRAEDQRLLKFFGGTEREQDFTNETLAASTAILSHFYALRNLQVQFPLARELPLAPEERAQLHALVQDHATAISADIDALGRQLAPLDSNFGLTPCVSSPAIAAMSWQNSSLEALEEARVVDHLLRALLTTSQAAATPDSALPEIDQNLCRLRVELRNLTASQH